MPWGAIIGAAVGAVKAREDAIAAAKERKRQAEMTRYSPWTGMQGHTVSDPSMIGGVASGALTGASFQQGLKGDSADASSMGDMPKPTEFKTSDTSMASSMPTASSKYSLMGGSAGSMSPSMQQPAVNQNAWIGMQKLNAMYDPNNPQNMFAMSYGGKPQGY